MGFTYKDKYYKDKDYLEYNRVDIYTSIREDYYKDFKQMYTDLKVPRTKCLDILVELLYDDEIMKRFLKRLREY
ncbi:hypothetical protein [Clostridium beijerinckii]|uniref:hypothetical protein n=1 Tax=Clostridium beijerinckii TaxID=1520 RepID=UPI00156D9DCF|nr:hypothetical protein [Clostridium beijerinckii]NRU52597.1 hypothetical protein [Clostridium beijerinckii]NYC68640.1 hypothetical protein [Clostridium beijerinckii]